MKRSFTLAEVVFAVLIFVAVAVVLFPLNFAVVKFFKRKATEYKISKIVQGAKNFHLDLGYFPTSLTQLVVNWPPSSDWKGPYVPFTLQEVTLDAFGSLIWWASNSTGAVAISPGGNRVFDSFAGGITWTSGNWEVVRDDIGQKITANYIVKFRKRSRIDTLAEIVEAYTLKNCFERRLNSVATTCGGAGSPSPYPRVISDIGVGDRFLRDEYQNYITCGCPGGECIVQGGAIVLYSTDSTRVVFVPCNLPSQYCPVFCWEGQGFNFRVANAGTVTVNVRRFRDTPGYLSWELLGQVAPGATADFKLTCGDVVMVESSLGVHGVFCVHRNIVCNTADGPCTP